MSNFIFDAAENARESENYKKWREVHTRAFGALYSEAFRDNSAAELQLTAALNNISGRKFEEAIPLLESAAQICTEDSDRAAVNTFLGMAYERLGDTEKMEECYELARASGARLEMVTQLHPYYYTAKMAQREMTFGKAVYYYQKALEFYDGQSPTGQAAETVSYIMYDLATIFVTTHRYDDCERFLKLSKSYSAAENQQRDYVYAILMAVLGKKEKSLSTLERLTPLLRDHGLPMAKAILEKRDPHYCVCPQDRSAYGGFIGFLKNNRKRIYSDACRGDTESIEKELGRMLTEAMPFMRKKLDCRVSVGNGVMTVRCRNYYVRSLAAEHEYLLGEANKLSDMWDFVSVSEY